MEFKYTSENTLDYLSLHDCTIENARVDDEKLILDFEHIDVLEMTCPQVLYHQIG